jgi:hypothetical protein
MSVARCRVGRNKREGQGSKTEADSRPT